VLASLRFDTLILTIFSFFHNELKNRFHLGLKTESHSALYKSHIYRNKDFFATLNDNIRFKVKYSEVYTKSKFLEINFEKYVKMRKKAISK